MDPDKSAHLSRRKLLLSSIVASSVPLAGCVGLGDDEESDVSGTPTPTSEPMATPTETPAAVDVNRWDFAHRVVYWAWFPSDDELWSRSADPYDFREDNKRWLAWPTDDGSVRCRVENDDAPGNAGFYIDLGQIGDIEAISIDSEVTASDSGEQQLVFAIYFDVTGNGEYFEWDREDEREAFADFGGDVEGIGVIPSGGTVTIDDNIQMDLIPPFEEELVTLADLKAGDIDGVNESTHAAIQVSVVGSGSDSVEEAVIHDVAIEEMTIPDPPAESWTMYGHDTFNSGHNRGSDGPTGPIDMRWEYSTDGPVRSSPAVMDNSVFIGSDDGTLHAIDAETGSEQWAYETGGPVRSSPAVFYDRVIFGSDDHGIYALNKETGDLLWDFETDGQVRAPPLVEAEVRIPDVDHIAAVGSHDGDMYVFDPMTGDLVHRQSTDGQISQAALSLIWRNWELIWGSEDSERHYWIPVSPYSPIPLDAPKTAATTWDERSRVMYEVTGFLERRAGGEFAYDWRFEADGEIHSSPALGEHIYVGSWDGTFYALNARTGEPEWTFDTGGKIDSSPAVGGEGVYFSSTDGWLYGCDTESGEILWKFETDGPIQSSPAVAEGFVCVGSDDGNVYAVTDE